LHVQSEWLRCTAFSFYLYKCHNDADAVCCVYL